MEKFYTSGREHAANVINFEKTKMLLLTKEKLISHQDLKVSYIGGKRVLKMFANDKKS